MAATTYTGSLTVATTDYKAVKWVGKTKAGTAITIEMLQAINKGNVEWTFAEKDDVCPEIEFEGVYEDSALTAGTAKEPWTILLADGAQTATSSEIVLGSGAFYIGTAGTTATNRVALTRGGGSFTVEREYREINADGDPGAVKGRIVQEGGRPKLKLTALQWLTNIADLYPGLSTVV